jgi:hypothetical protein
MFREPYLYVKRYEDKVIDLDKLLSGREKRKKRRKEQRKRK